MMSNGPVVVVGAGIIGLCCAYALRRRGLEVVVVEAGSPGSGASHGNGGWICPSFSGPVPAPGVITSALRWLLRPDSPLTIRLRPDLQFARWLWAFYRKCNEHDYVRGLDAIAQLNKHTIELFDAMAAAGVAFEMHEQGLLFLFQTQEVLEREARDLKRMERYGYPAARILARDELRAMEPAVSERVRGGVLAPAERHVRPESVVAGLVEWLTENGVPVRSGELVRGFVRQRGRVVGVETTRETRAASHVVLAAGMGTGRLASLGGTQVPLEAGKGYSVTVARSSLQVQRPLYCTEARVGISPYEGAVRVLGMMDLSGTNLEVPQRRIETLKRAPGTYLRDWTVNDIQEEWAGMRPLTPDGLPMIGRTPRDRNVIIATGHAMLGVTLGPATGEAVADIITGQPDETLLAPFRADRF